MGEFLKHFASGMENAFVVGTPDFNINNQYADVVNIANDLRASIVKATTCEQRHIAKTKKRYIKRK